jgi:deaminated glutathione amidase
LNTDATLKVATCQFPISGDIASNAKYIKRLIRKAVSNGADVVHFSECALSGYAGVDFDSWENFDWDELQKETEGICELLKELGAWAVLGSTHALNATEKPTNCLYTISNTGEIVSRYDKRMLTGNDLKYYSAGRNDAIGIINVKGVSIGLMICYDSSHPEMFTHYHKKGVKVLLLSLYNAKNRGKSFLNEITPAIIRTRASDYNMWILANNSSASYSNWPTCITSPDGIIRDKLSKHKIGILYHEFPDENYKKWKV